MSALDAVLAGISGGVKAGLGQYGWEKEYEQKNRQIDANTEIQRLRQELAVQLQSMKGDVARDVADTRAQQARDVEDARVRGRTDSARIAAEARGASDEAQKLINQWTNSSRERIAAGVQEGENRRWDTPSGNAKIGAATTQRGQDIAARTARSGQSITQTLGLTANAVRLFEASQRAASDQAKLDAEYGTGTGARPQPFGLSPNTEVVNGTERPTATPIEVVTEPPAPPAPKSDGANADKLQRLGDQIDSLMQQIKTAPTAAQRNALRRQLAPVLKQYQDAGGK